MIRMREAVTEAFMGTISDIRFSLCLLIHPRTEERYSK